MKCPDCNSNNVVAETKVNIRYKLNETGTVDIISEWSDLAEQINSSNVHECECLDCNHSFYEFTKEKE